MAELKKTLPPSVANAQGIGTVLDSCDSELDRLETEARAACCRLAAGTTDEAGCTLWERELGLAVREDLPMEVRKNLIRIGLEGRETCTPQRLKNLLGRMLEGQITLTEQFAQYRVELSTQVERFLVASLRQVEGVLRQATPAHLEVHLSAAASRVTEAVSRRGMTAGMKLEITTEEEIT